MFPFLPPLLLVWTLWPSGMLANTLPPLEEEEEVMEEEEVEEEEKEKEGQ